ncbi:DNA repair and recombination protein RAD54B-like [Ruditapes philippinarum]|uniref:DNA repair and recombination protein RAD54B-like n=1 Tax=Ruditapes philippinarum TaxID=129788 RepID=UPI00295AD748|nr:DNA repair and recombination protein RAD54B-like [Ruditapes philippinarum]XP_060591370.1 DNA repair and recombination protein RAD54B-like [Ruditapes philippinarum]
MRRSAAPSQAGRPKFVSPILLSKSTTTTVINKQAPTCTNTSVPEACQKSNILKRIFPESCNNGQCDEETSSDDKDDSKQADGDSEENFVSQVAKKPRFQAPSFNTPTISSSPVTKLKTNNENIGEEDKGIASGYFSVVWCKRSNKKHKKWEGDAVLVTRGRSVTLYDIEGKEIGKGSGYKSAELASLKEDETLPIGGKEIQVMSLLTEDLFKSGKCFTGNTVTSSAPLPKVPVKNVSKPFSKPLKAGCIDSTVSKPEPVVVKPRYDPTIPGALVMPAPSDSHQWQWNKRSLPVVDVVIDPYLSSNLRPHQREGVTFLYECVMGYRNYSGQGAILADDMGLGKTLQCISLIWTLYKQGPYGGKPVAKRILVITPGSLVKNWHQEFKKWLGFERLQVYAVSSDKKVEDFMKTSLYPVLIISYEMFVRMFETLQQLTFDLIVCDEGHRLKNTNIKTTSLIMSLPTQRRVVLTGTPIQNDLQEFFSIVEFCNPGVLGTSAGFRRVYEDPIVASRQPGATKEEISLGEERGVELSRMTQMFILRRTQEINNKYLPPKRDIVLFCRPSALQLTLYQQLLRCQLIRSCLSGSMSGSPHLICIGALKQLCNHPSLVYKKSLEHEDNKNCEDYDENRSVYGGLHSLFPEGFCIDKGLEEHSGKLAVLSSLLQHLNSVQSCKPEKIVVVSNHTKTLDLIQCLCDQIQYKYLRLDGQTPTSKRQELVQRFNSKHSPEFIFLLSSKAGGVGLNLVGASRLVLYDIDWNPANDLQAMARVWRDGQKNVVHIYRLLTTGSIEEKIYQRQISKQGLSGAVMDVREKNTAVQFSLEDLRDLFSVNMSTDCDTHDLLNCDCGARNTVQPVQQNIHTATNRPCQLGVKAMPKRQNLGMDELMEWKHLPSSVINKHPTWYLQDTIQNVSFVFYNEINGNTKQDSNISGVT